ncbi:hypothetical protein AC578_102 [Pseudocercospora eumusae]|uniref:Lysophospholipase n=1 Tax=Pseudocercospora eumusae TaxID=321146 RepID=A0A139HP91_9PEZI|nr:hypothetical protein AC578_102 [Pseudocercospora eumusae]
MAFHSLLSTLALLGTTALAAPAPGSLELRQPARIEERQLLPILDNDYAPKPTACPSTPLVRAANGLSQNEASYFSSRKPKASTALAAWLKQQGAFSTSSQPVIGFASSGGGYRALLETAGVIQALDARDSTANVSGVFQSLTYESGLSGGGWFLSAFSGNNWPTVSSLRDGLWEQSFQNSLLLPANVLGFDEYPEVVNDLAKKKAAGFDNTIVDPYGRLLSYQLLYGKDGGDEIRMSGLTTLSNFTSFNVPYPIITALGVDNSYQGQCTPTINATQYEFHPYEYGSWDSGVSAFALTQFMGTNITNGQATQSGKCIKDYDNIGYIFGTSSDVFAALCSPIQPSNSSSSDLSNVLEGILSANGQKPTFQDLYGIYPNPFYKYQPSSRVSSYPLITMADGGLAGQNVPIWPFIQPARTVDVLIANDNSADTSDNFPNGTEIRQTYENALASGLTKMPYIPPVEEFVSRGLNKRATFFGCDSPQEIFIIYLPNVNYTYASNQPTSKIQYSVSETNSMIQNGNAIATQNGTAGWSFCMACGIKARDGNQLPQGCDACFEKYCYHKS